MRGSHGTSDTALQEIEHARRGALMRLHESESRAAEDAAVDLAAQTVTVQHGPDVPREALSAALTKAGFPAT